MFVVFSACFVFVCFQHCACKTRSSRVSAVRCLAGVYKKAADTDLDTYEIELDECIKSSNTKVDRSSKVGIGLGSYFLVGGLYTLVTASGVLAPIALAAGTAGGILGGSTIFATVATDEFREYRSLENCLEYKGHEVVFYDANK